MIEPRKDISKFLPAHRLVKREVAIAGRLFPGFSFDLGTVLIFTLLDEHPILLCERRLGEIFSVQDSSHRREPTSPCAPANFALRAAHRLPQDEADPKSGSKLKCNHIMILHAIFWLFLKNAILHIRPFTLKPSIW